MYIREAHPTDGRQTQANVREGILIADPKTLEKREEVARDFAAQFKVRLPILVDTIDNTVDKAYTAKPDRIYVIDAKGKIAYKGGPGPMGFKVADVPPVLDRLLGVQLAAKAGLGQPSSGPGGPFGRFAGPAQPGKILPEFLQERLQLTEKQKQQLEELQKEIDAKLEKILSAEQRKRLEEMRQRARRMGGPGGRPGDRPSRPPAE
jgi:hypothetical protein